MSTTLPGACPVCSHVLRLPADATGKKTQCRGCGSTLAIVDGAGEGFELILVRRGDAADRSTRAADAEPAQHVRGEAESASTASDAPCPRCGAGVQAGDAYCGACGADLVEARKAEYRAETDRRRKSRASAQRHAVTRRAAGWLLALAVLFAIGAIAQGLLAQREARAAHRNLAEFGDSELLALEGDTMTAGALRQQIDLEVALTWGIGFGLAAIMLALYFWAKRAPFPAMLTGLCLFLVLIVLQVVVEPAAIVKGIVIKVLAISGLIGGMNAALTERAARAESWRRRR